MKYTGFHETLEIDFHFQKARHWQVHLCSQVVLDQVDAFRRECLSRGERAPSYTAILMKAIGQAIAENKQKYPQLNSFIQRGFFGKKIHCFEKISAGTSAALPDSEDFVALGTVLDPEKKSVQEISNELSKVTEPGSMFVSNAKKFNHLPKLFKKILIWISSNSSRIRYKHRGTFCLNPVGKYGVDFHLSVPQTASLQFGMGIAAKRPIVRDGNVIAANTLYLTLSFDRRVMNGRPPALLLDRIKTIVEEAKFR